MENNKKSSVFSGSTIILVLIVIALVGARISEGLRDDQPAALQQQEDLDYSEVEALYDELRVKYNGELDAEKLIEGLKAGLVSGAGDPYTAYLTPLEAAEITESINGQFSGIGAELSAEEEYVIVVAPIDGFPAKEAGLEPGDKILAVDDEPVIGESIEKVVSMIRGEVGTDVKLTIRRVNENIDFTITRQQIDIASVTWEVRDDQVGYLRVSSFADGTTKLVRQALKEFEDNSVKGVVLDVRSNGGGLLSASVDIADMWLDEGVIVQQESTNDSKDTTYKATKGTLVDNNLTTVVLIDGGSASASEILAAALSDNNAATTVGVKSFGKGTVQEFAELDDDDGWLKVTVAQWLTPAGAQIDGQGIEPEVAVEYDPETEEDEQLEKAVEIILK